MGLYQKVSVVNGPAERVFLQTINPVRDHAQVVLSGAGVLAGFGCHTWLLTPPTSYKGWQIRSSFQDGTSSRATTGHISTSRFQSGGWLSRLVPLKMMSGGSWRRQDG